MADRVHPRDSSPLSSPDRSRDVESACSPRKPDLPVSDKPVPHPAGTYVIQIPKDQIYRVPSPENARRFEGRSGRKPRRGLRRCCCCFFLTLISLLVLAGIAAGLFYLIVKPEAPSYSVDKISISGLNLTSSSAISPAIDVTVRANNPNDKIGIYYKKGSSVNVYYSDVKLCDGAVPVFYQPTNNVTVFVTALRGSDIALNSELQQTLLTEQTQGNVPLKLNIRAPVKLKVGGIKTWEITVKVSCDLTVDKLTTSSTIESVDCSYGVDLF